jgi:hypothetical protein
VWCISVQGFPKTIFTSDKKEKDSLFTTVFQAVEYALNPEKMPFESNTIQHEALSVQVILFENLSIKAIGRLMIQVPDEMAKESIVVKWAPLIYKRLFSDIPKYVYKHLIFTSSGYERK